MSLVLLLLAAFGGPAIAESLDPPPTCEPAESSEPLRVYLITASPGNDLFSVFGHSALWVSGAGLRRPRILNWGAFDSSIVGPVELVQGFLDGTMDYWLDIESLDDTRERFDDQDQRAVMQQVMLPPAMRGDLERRLRAEATPRDRSYRYHWSDRNCATQIRDVLNEAAGGEIQAQISGATDATYRGDVLRHLGPWPPVWFGWHFAAAAYGDTQLDRWQRMFLPDRLQAELETVTIPWDEGERRPLLAAPCDLRSEGRPWVATEPPSRGGPMFLIGALLGGLIALMGWSERRAARVAAGAAIGLFGLLGGVLGTVSVGLWLTSSLEGFGPNENWLVLGPQTFGLVAIGGGLVFGRRFGGRYALGLLALGALAVIPFTDQQHLDVMVVVLPILAGIAAALRGGATGATPGSR